MDLSILLTDDSEIQSLNKKFRDKDCPTDVLSFSMFEELAGEVSVVEPVGLGDVVISLETAKKQAKELGVSLSDELFRLLIHGTLHLLGYDHVDVSPEEVEAMETKEQYLFELVLGAVEERK